MPRTELSEDDILAFVFAGCNASEIAAYGGMSEVAAQARINHALRVHAGLEARQTLHLPA